MSKVPISFLCSASMIVFASPAFAQGAGNSSVEDEIVVTAQKRAENVQDVPISISVVTGEAIGESGIVRFEDLGSSIPNFSVSANASSDTISIRGINSDGQPGSEQSVGIYVDGVYRGRGVQSRFAFLDIERIEVLRGPQGTLFGKNTIAGAVSITSAKPTSKLSAAVQGMYEFNHNEGDIRGHISGPLSDRLNGRIAFLYNQLNNGWAIGQVLNSNTGAIVPEPVPGIFAVLPVEVTPHAYSARISDARFLPQVSVRWEAADGLNLYASYASLLRHDRVRFERQPGARLISATVYGSFLLIG